MTYSSARCLRLCCFTIGKFLIGMYLGKASFGSTYGAAGSLVIVLVWVYYSAQIFFFGAEFTQVYAEAVGSDPFQSEATPRNPQPPFDGKFRLIMPRRLPDIEWRCRRARFRAGGRVGDVENCFAVSESEIGPSSF